jgi:hypothetical protein
MEQELPPLQTVLGKLPWFGDLSREHRSELLAEVTERLVVETSRDEFTRLLLRWASVAHDDAKWRRFFQLRETGILEPPAA